MPENVVILKPMPQIDVRPKVAALVVALAILAGCGEVRMYGQAAAEYRREMNDLQAQGTMAAICDLSIGSYWRTLTAAERALIDLQCGGGQQVLPLRLEAFSAR